MELLLETRCLVAGLYARVLCCKILKYANIIVVCKLPARLENLLRIGRLAVHLLQV